MNRTHGIASVAEILVGILVVAAAPMGCSGSKTGIQLGTGGATQGVGGGTGMGTGGAGQGAGGVMTGAGGVTGLAGSGTGGRIAEGTGGVRGTGGDATGGSGGNGGNGGTTTLVLGTGGGGGRAGTGAGGSGTGGGTTVGAGGASTGGASGLDGGAPDALPATCNEIASAAVCDARSDCHSVFVDPGNCRCASLGCCAVFQNCADGKQADCTGAVACTIDTPHCEGPYVVSVRGSCYEGCVRQTDCALPACPNAPPASGAACGPLAQTCNYENCAGAGRTIATCAGGSSAWQVTTSPCAASACEDPGFPSGLTCAAGKVCIITRSIGGTLMVTSTCVDHTCGTGPITPQCVPGLYGTCTEVYSTTGAIFRCDLVADCGDAGCA